MINKNIDIVKDLLIGSNSIPLDLRKGEGLNEDKYTNLIYAIKKLIEFYQTKDSVSKGIALCFVDIGSQFYFDESMYSKGQVERLEDCANELSFLGQELFSQNCS